MKNLKIQVSKRIARELSNYTGLLVSYGELSVDTYLWNVDSELLKNQIDFIPETGKMRVLSVTYPDNYYAMNRYITTSELLYLFRRSDKTYNGFMQAVADEIEI